MSLRSALVATFCLLLAVPALARGQIEERVARARELIQQNNLNEAELLLVEIEREDPERQEEVEEMRALIRSARRGYNQLYAELIQNLREGRDEDQAVAIIRRLEALDTNPNPATARLIFEAKRTVLFKQSQRRFEQLMDQALALLERGAFLDALALYQGGFEIHREVFDDEPYDSVTKTSILRLLNQVENTVLLAVNPQGPFVNLRDRITTALQNPQLAEGPWLDIRRNLLDWLNLLGTAETSLTALRQQNELLSRAAGLARGDPYLVFMTALISGRDGLGRQEGVLGAFTRFFRSNLETAVAGLSRRAANDLDRGLRNLGTGEFSTAPQNFERAAQAAGIAVGMNALWFPYLIPGDTPRAESEDLLRSAFGARETARLIVETALPGAELARLRLDLEPLVQTPPQDLEQLTRAAVTSRAHATTAQRTLEKLRQDLSRATTIQGAGYPLSIEGIQAALAPWQAQVGFFRNAEVEFYSRRAGLVFPSLVSRVEALEALFQEGNRSLAGEKRQDELGLEYTSRSPRQALERFQQAQDGLERTSQDVLTFRNDSQAIVELVPEEPRIQAWVNQASALLARLNTLRSGLATILPQVRAQVTEAESLLIRARETLVAVESALSQQRFRDARAALDNARSLWEASFLIQDDRNQRATLERQRESLAAAILNGEREQVARDVRALIQQGSQAYLQSRFLQAEEILLRARDRWADTESEPNIEVEQWLGLTRNALTFSSGRELNKTDPLYFEIQPLLNFAVQDFELARQLWQQNRRSEAQDLLQRASLRLEQVRIPFPLNQTAGVLQLRILQLTASPQEFNAAFGNLFNRARSLAQTNPTQALADLQDLAAIQPDYPGLQQLIRQLRITVGLDPPPPDPANLARSRQLTAQADRIVAANQFGRFGEARALVEEALRLDPTNAEAQRLLDRILITGPRTGTAATLTPEERSSLDQAAQLFNQGRFFEARAIVDRLLSIPKNRTNPEILKLQTSINARLRI